MAKAAIGIVMNISSTCISHISNLQVIDSVLSQESIENMLYESALTNQNPIFQNEVIASSNGVDIQFSFKTHASQLVSLGYIDEGKITLFASNIGKLYAKTEGKKSVAVGALDRILHHLNYNQELIQVLSTRLPDYFNKDLTCGFDEKTLDDARYLGFVKMDFCARNGSLTGLVKPCLRKYNVVVYQCHEPTKDDYSFIVIDKKNDLNLYFSNIDELESSKIGKSYKLTSAVINTKPLNTPFISTL